MAKKQNENMNASDFNMITVESEKLESHLDISMKLQSNVFLAGRRGSGKTEISKQRIKANDYHELYLNMSVLERTDFGGFPKLFNGTSDFVSYMLPQFFEMLLDPNPKAKKCVVLLDEVDKAAPDLHAPLLEFTQFHSMNGRYLPNLQSVIMTGNLIAEGGHRPSLPLLDRAEKYIIQPNVNSWLKWAGKSQKVHPSVVAFITDKQDELFGDVDPDDRYADPSPRGWVNASRILFEGEKISNVNTEILLSKVSGCVGKKAGLGYKMYYTHYQELLPLVDNIFNIKNKKDLNTSVKQYEKLDPGKKFIALMILCSRFAGKLDSLAAEGTTLADLAKTNKTPDYVNNIGEFMARDEVQIENSLIALRNQIHVDRVTKHSLDDNEHWNNILTKIQHSLNGTN